MPGPKKPTAAEKLITMQQLLAQRAANGVPPSERVQVALRSFQTAPTPAEIDSTADSMLQSGAPQDALEFRVYATQMAAPDNAMRDAAQRQFDAGAAPHPAVVQALNSFKLPPTPEAIEAVGNHLRATQGPEVAQQFETYAANMSPQARMAQQPMRTQPIPENVQPKPRQGVTTVEEPKAQPQLAQAGAEPGLLQRAKSYLFEGPGTDMLKSALGFGEEKKPAPKVRQGTTEGYDPKKERELLDEAKKANAR